MANVLIVDNSDDLLDVLSIFLEMKGHLVLGLLSHKEAIAALTTFAPDIILLDVKLNGGDGRELCREIKQKHNPNIPIILLSASVRLLKNYEECLADDFIEKPFDLDYVAEKIDDLLKKKLYPGEGIAEIP